MLAALVLRRQAHLPFGQQAPLHLTRCDGQRPVTAAHASAGVHAAAEGNLPAKAQPAVSGDARQYVPS